MTRMVKCVKLDKESEGLAQAPYPGELGQRLSTRMSLRRRGRCGCGIKPC